MEIKIGQLVKMQKCVNCESNSQWLKNAYHNSSEIFWCDQICQLIQGISTGVCAFVILFDELIDLMINRNEYRTCVCVFKS